MNPVLKLLNSAIIAINRMLDSMSIKTVKSIQRGFYFVTFLLCIIAIIFGYNIGTKSAKIKRPPLAEFVNDTFNTDISREKDMGSFSGMLESERIKEADPINSTKFDFFVKERLHTESDNNVIDTGKTSADTDPEEKTYKIDSPVDDYKQSGQNDTRIKAIDRSNSNETTGDIIKNNKKDESSKEQKNISEKTDIRFLDKDKTIIPKTIQKDQGTPEQ